MLKAEHVTKKYRKTIAVNDVSFTLEPGSVTVLLGPNGAGKIHTFQIYHRIPEVHRRDYSRRDS